MSEITDEMRKSLRDLECDLFWKLEKASLGDQLLVLIQLWCAFMICIVAIFHDFVIRHFMTFKDWAPTQMLSMANVTTQKYWSKLVQFIDLHGDVTSASYTVS